MVFLSFLPHSMLMQRWNEVQLHSGNEVVTPPSDYHPNLVCKGVEEESTVRILDDISVSFTFRTIHQLKLFLFLTFTCKSTDSLIFIIYLSMNFHGRLARLKTQTSDP